VHGSEGLRALLQLFSVRRAVTVNAAAEASAAGVARPLRLGANQAQVWQRVAG
jgi:hypothetical protein